MNDTWNPRLDVIEALEADGWTGDAMSTNEPLRKNGADWATVTDCGDSQLTGPGAWNVAFPSDTPAVVIVAACLAASRPAA